MKKIEERKKLDVAALQTVVGGWGYGSGSGYGNGYSYGYNYGYRGGNNGSASAGGLINIGSGNRS